MRMNEDDVQSLGCISIFAIIGGIVGAWLGAYSPERHALFANYGWLVLIILIFISLLMTLFKFTPINFFPILVGKYKPIFLTRWLSAMVLVGGIALVGQHIGSLGAGLLCAVSGGLFGAFALTSLLFDID